MESSIGNNFKYLKNNGAYLIDNGDGIYIYVKYNVSTNVLLDLFEIENYEDL